MSQSCRPLRIERATRVASCGTEWEEVNSGSIQSLLESGLFLSPIEGVEDFLKEHVESILVYIREGWLWRYIFT